MSGVLSRLDNMRLQTRISLLVSVGLVVVLGLFTFLSIRVVQDTTDRIVRERLVVTQMTATYVETLLQEVLADLSKAATFASFDASQADLADEEHLMAHAYGQLGSFTQGLLLLDPRGRVVVSQPSSLAPVGEDLSAEPHIREAIETGHDNISNAFLNPITNKPTVAATIVVRNAGGTVVSLLSGLVDLNSPAFANSLIHATRLGRTGHADLIDANGIVVASSDNNHILELNEHPEFYYRVMQERISAVESAPYIEHGAYEGNHVMAFVPLKLARWGIGLGGADEETYAPVRRIQIEAGMIGVISLVVALIFVWATTNKIVRPIEDLIVASQRMAAGDLSNLIRVAGGGEVGRLAATFDRMRLQLQAAHHDLTLEKSRYQSIFDSMADPVFTVDTALRVTSWNPAAERLLGWRPHEVTGVSCESVLQPTASDAGLACRDTCPLLPESDWRKIPVSMREVIQTRQGQKLTVETTRAPIFDEGRLVGVVHVLRDVSAQEELDRLKQQFISNVSHELRSPLGHIMGYATTLLRRDARWDERTSQKFLREIVHGSEQLQKLVDELLDMSRLESGRFPIEKQPVHVGQIARAAAKSFRARTKKHKFVVSMPQGLPLALADPHRTEQVLRNLLENAVKYAPEGGCISVLAAAEDGMVVVSVSDEGIGIAEDQLERIFERFHRVDSTLARQTGGVGLGLSICRKIVEAHGGQIWAESKPGQGSSFHFSLPAFHDDAQALKPARDESRESRVEGRESR